MSEQQYSVGIGLSIIPYIGPDLYSNVPAVISELIANAWDAKATKVNISIDLPNDTIIIEDNGQGMSFSEINSKYLHIGHKKRAESKTVFDVNGKARHVMGRKGIGKLAPFALAEELEIQSSDGKDKVGCIMQWSKFKEAIDADETVFVPDPVSDSDLSISKGTKLSLRILRSDKKSSLKNVSRLRKQLARRFTVIYPDYDFDVQIDGISIVEKDRPYLKKLEFIWPIGDYGQAISKRCPNLSKKPSPISDSVIIDGIAYKLEGWVGTVEQPGDINSDGNNTIAIFAHGKLAQEDILSEMGEKQVFASYVVGDIQADFLDDDTQEDIITPDRQRLNQSDPRYTAIKNYVKDVALKEISKNWNLWRLERSISIAMGIPGVESWYNELTKTQQRKAAGIFQKIARLDTTREVKKEYCQIVATHFRALNQTSSLSRLSDQEFIELLQKYSAPAQTSSSSFSPNVQDQDISSSDPSTAQTQSTDETPDQGEDDAEGHQRSIPQTDITQEETESSYPTQQQNEEKSNNEAEGSDEGQRPDGTRPTQTKAPKYQADHHFQEIETFINELPIEVSLRNVALFDLNEAQIAYNNTAYKACIVMLGAVVEGIMLATLRRSDVLMKLLNTSPAERPKFWGQIVNPNQPFNPQETADKIATDIRITFEDYRKALIKLIPDVENQKVENIQHFRNSIHPYKAVSDPSIFGSPDSARALNYITALVIIVKQIKSWTP